MEVNGPGVTTRIVATGINKTSTLIESSAGPLTQSDLDMLHHVYGDFVWPTGSEGRPVPGIAFDIAEARNLQRAQGLQANLKSTAVEVMLLKQLDTEHYNVQDLAKGLNYLQNNGVQIGAAGQNLLDRTSAGAGSYAQPQDPDGTYL